MSKSTPGDMPGARQSNVILQSGGRRENGAASGCNERTSETDYFT